MDSADHSTLPLHYSWRIAHNKQRNQIKHMAMYGINSIMAVVRTSGPVPTGESKSVRGYRTVNESNQIADILYPLSFFPSVGYVVARSRNCNAAIDLNICRRQLRELGRKAERSRLRHLALRCPRLDGDGKDLAGHDKGGESHAHGEREHRIQIVVDHCFNHIAGLGLVSDYHLVCFGILTLSMKIRPPEIRQKEEMTSVGGRAGR